jgi:hypothetical protein
VLLHLGPLRCARPIARWLLHISTHAALLRARCWLQRLAWRPAAATDAHLAQAMAAVAGILFTDLLGLPKWYEAGAQPYGIPPIALLAIMAPVMGFLETKRLEGFLATGKSGFVDTFPFDPLNQSSPTKELNEVKNGRLAMVSRGARTRAPALRFRCGCPIALHFNCACTMSMSATPALSRAFRRCRLAADVRFPRAPRLRLWASPRRRWSPAPARWRTCRRTCLTRSATTSLAPSPACPRLLGSKLRRARAGSS